MCNLGKKIIFAILHLLMRENGIKYDYWLSFEDDLLASIYILSGDCAVQFMNIRCFHTADDTLDLANRDWRVLCIVSPLP